MRTTLVRFSPDLTTKATATRKRFSERLAANLRAALRAEGLRAEVSWTLARLVIEHEESEAVETATRLFGVHSVSPAWRLPLAEADRLLARIAERVAPRVSGRRFAVRARVRDRRFGASGQRVNERLGALLVQRGGFVDLSDPEITVRLEARDGWVWVYDRALPGPGGLPLGVGGRAVLLLSGGFDSAVAAWRLMRRGVVPELVALRLGGTEHASAVERIADVLARRWAPGLGLRLTLVPFEEAVERIRAGSPPRLWQLLLKRAMYTVAERVARRRRCDAIVTGEALGQVSSQTLRNLRALEAGASLPVLRPLLTEDKERIVVEARHIGTEAISASVPEYCGLGGRKPATAASPREVMEAEEALGLPLERWLQEAVVRRLGTHDDRGTDTPKPQGPRDAPPLDVAEPPSGSRIVDLRPPAMRRRCPLRTAAQVLVPADPVAWLEGLDPTREEAPFVVLCEQGRRSAWLAHALRRRGFSAYRWAWVPEAEAETRTSETGGGP